MSGYLEQMAAAIQACQAEIVKLTARLDALGQPQQQPVQQFAQPQFGQPQQGQPVQQFAGQPVQQYQQPVQQQPQGVQAPALPTDPQQAAAVITEYVMKHVDNPAIKEALGNEMRAMGIGALGEAQPHQYVELFQRFHNAVARFPAQGQAQQQAAPVSII